MRLLVFGATGGTGREIVNQALERGHYVTAFARKPERLGISHQRLSVARGDVIVLNDTRVFPARLIGRRVPMV
jgi:uncharacterized protein YbjT (DUF2867 family)